MESKFKEWYGKGKGSLVFIHGTMGSSKSAQCIMKGVNYELQKKGVIYMKPELDTRGTKGFITSRAIVEPKKCYTIKESENLYDNIEEHLKSRKEKIYAILIDESQFLTKEQVIELSKLRIKYDINIMCYGLKNSYREGELFPGSKTLLYFADEFEEIKNFCQYCGRDATMNLLIENDKPKRDGELVVIGNVEEDNGETQRYYVPTCVKHYYNPKIELKGRD